MSKCTISIEWLKTNLWDKLDMPEQHNAQNVLASVWSQLEKKTESPLFLPATSLDADDVIAMFGLISKFGNSEDVWKLKKNEFCDIPTGLSTILGELFYVIGASHKNEAFVRCVINTILVSCTAAERRLAEEPTENSIQSSSAASQIPPMVDLERPITPTETEPVQLQFETSLRYLVEYKKQKRMLTGFADYSLWYDKRETMGTNLVVVKAKRSGNAASALGQCLAYMAIVHDIRKTNHKRNKVIYGICTDGAVYHFLRIDNDSVVTESQPLKWGLGAIGNKKIVSYIRYIVRAAIYCTPRTSPVKFSTQMEERLTAYNSHEKFDYGFQNLSLAEDSESDSGSDNRSEVLLELSDIE